MNVQWSGEQIQAAFLGEETACARTIVTYTFSKARMLYQTMNIIALEPLPLPMPVEYYQKHLPSASARDDIDSFR